MPVESRWHADVPAVSLQTWVFGSCSDPIPRHPCYLDAGRPTERLVTFSDFRLLSKRLAWGLQRRGVGLGDRVLMFSANGIYFPVVFMGTLMAGAIFTGAGPLMTARELAYQIRDSQPALVFASRGLLDTALQAASQAKLPRDRVWAFEDVLDEPHAGLDAPVGHWTALLAAPADAEPFRWVEPADPRNTTCCLNYSSGTTGLPKGVEVSHYAYVANGVAASLHAEDSKDARAGEVARESGVIVYLPLYHVAAQTAVMASMPRMGTKCYIMPAFDFERVLQYTQDYRVSLLVLAPPVAVLMAKSALVRRYDLSSVTQIACGTAPLGADVQAAVAALWPPGHVRFRQAWGMTELTCLGTAWDPERQPVNGSVGEMVCNSVARLVDATSGDEIATSNTPGELWFSGPTVMRGYWRNDKATRETLVQHGGRTWLRTGDVAYFDKYEPGGLVFMVDRAKELIKVKGFQVAPAELEALLLEKEDVEDAAVVGVTVKGQEMPRAYVVRKRGSTTTKREIATWLEGRVAPYKRLQGGVVFVDSIPKLPSGKIVRRILRERAQGEVGDANPKGSKLA